MRRKSGFYTRGFTTFVLTAAFFIIAVTGVVLYVTPRGRVAHWTNWTLLGLGKEQWGAVHMTAATLFLVAAGLHLFFNWKVLLGYIRLKRVAGFRLKREFAAAVALCAFFVLGTLTGLPPFSNIVQLHDDVKDYWDRASVEAPMPHAEELRLDELAREMDLPVEKVVTALGEEGYDDVSPNMKVARIARANEVAPSAVYQAIRTKHATADSHQTESQIRGPRLGTMTLGEFCSAETLPLDAVIASLTKRGVTAKDTSSLRELATFLNMRPGQLASMVRADVGGAPVEPERLSCTSSEGSAARER